MQRANYLPVKEIADMPVINMIENKSKTIIS